MVESETIKTVITHAAIQEATAVVKVMREVDTGHISDANTTSSMWEVCRQRQARPALKQLSFNWNAPDKYIELLSFEMEITNLLQTKMYEWTEEEKVPTIKKLLGRECLQLIQIFTDLEIEVMQCSRRITFHLRWAIQATPHWNHKVLAILKLKRKSQGSSKGRIDRWEIKVPNCKYKGYDRRLKEHFINGLDDETIIAEFIKNYSLERCQWCEQKLVMIWTQKVEAQMTQKEMLNNIRDVSEFDVVRRDRQKHGNSRQQRDNGNGKKIVENCKYYGTGHPQKLCPMYGKKCSVCGKINHFKAVCRTTQRQRQGQRSPWGSKAVQKLQQDEGTLHNGMKEQWQELWLSKCQIL